MAAIRRLWAEYWAGRDSASDLRGWLEKKWGVSDLRFLSADAAPKVLTALHAMCDRRTAAAPDAGGPAKAATR